MLIPRDERICKYCKYVHNKTVIENEFHFVMAYPAYNDMQQNFLILGVILKKSNTNHVNIFYNQLSTCDDTGMRKLSMFLHHSFNIRNVTVINCIVIS